MASAVEKEAYREIMELVHGCMDLKRKWNKLQYLRSSLQSVTFKAYNFQIVCVV